MAIGLPPATVKKFELATTDERERAFIRALCSVYPSQIRAFEIMRALGMAVPMSRDVTGNTICRDQATLIKFHNLRIRVSQLLISFGWQVERTGGTVTDAYRVEFMGLREAA
ncbi:MAG: hypothetical protein LCH99_15645 [Proteobacteria bacterium]|nr:hypothetical protein [Pseudomonadota bacterium]